MNFSRMLDSKDDFYLDIYFLLKERLLAGHTFKRTVAFENFRGMSMARPNGELIRINSWLTMMMELGLCLSKDQVIAGARTRLIDLDQPIYYVHSDEDISLEFKISNVSKVFKGNAKLILESREISKYLNDTSFKGSKELEVKATLLSEGAIRAKKEQNILDPSHGPNLQKVFYKMVKNITMNKDDKELGRRHMKHLQEMGLITVTAQAAAISQLKEWAEFYKNKTDQIPYKSITQLEMIIVNAPNYEEFYHRIKAEK